MLQSLFDKTVSVNRLIQEVGTNKLSYQQLYETVHCHIQPLTDSFTGDIEGGFGKDFLLVCPVIDIREDDRIIYKSKEYRITSISSLSFVGDSHMEITIRIFDN